MMNLRRIHYTLKDKQEAQLLQRDRAMLRVVVVMILSLCLSAFLFFLFLLFFVVASFSEQLALLAAHLW